MDKVNRVKDTLRENQTKCSNQKHYNKDFKNVFDGKKKEWFWWT